MVQAVALAACISSGSTEVVVNQICRMYAAAEQKRHRLRLQPQLSAQPLRRRRRAWPLSCSSARIDILLSFCKALHRVICACRRQRSGSARRLRLQPQQIAQPLRRRKHAWLPSCSSARSRSVACLRKLLSVHDRLPNSDAGTHLARGP